MASYAFEQAIAHLEAQAARDKTSSNPFGISRDMFETWRGRSVTLVGYAHGGGETSEDAPPSERWQPNGDLRGSDARRECEAHQNRLHRCDSITSNCRQKYLLYVLTFN